MGSELDKSYGQILHDLKEKIRQARLRASVAVNAQLIQVYWEIGRTILEQQKKSGWGKKIIKRLSMDLRAEFPDMRGFSERNLVYMQTFASIYPDFTQPSVAQFTRGQSAQSQPPDNQISEITQPAVAQLGKLVGHLPWAHNIVLLDKLSTPHERLFFAQKCIQNGWSKAVLIHQIDSGLITRQGKAITNFEQTLPKYQSDLARETLKNPYFFGFLGMEEEVHERELEKALIQHIKKFLLELGRGFAFVGNQHNLAVDGDDFFLDLLFYNFHLHCFVVFDLKVRDFMPEYAGKINFYINAIDQQIKGPDDKPTIGVLLCKTPNETVVKFALTGIQSPIGVAEYELINTLPKQLKAQMPTVEELEAELDKELQENMSEVERRLKLVKERVKAMQTDELQTPVTYQLLQEIFEKSLKPLFRQILVKFSTTFQKEFMTQRTLWKLKDKTVYGIEDVEDFWRTEENLKNAHEILLQYELSGFKKIGTENIDVYLSLKFWIQPYWYGFSLSGHHDGQPFLKKMYHQQLTNEETQSILDLMVTKVLDRIESLIENFEAKKEK
jgi:predicted nuclease of restriction endonuclease-like (RecB) superfamily